MARRRIVPVPVPARGPGTSATDQPGPATATFADLPTPIIRPYVAPYSAEFRHQAVLLTRSTDVPVTHVARDLGISIGTLRDWITQALLRQAGITCSMGRPGTCLDNAVAETFFATLKVELIHRSPWPSRADVVQAIFASVETWYTPHRRHGSLGYLSPVAFEACQPSAPSVPKPMPVRYMGASQEVPKHAFGLSPVG